MHRENAFLSHKKEILTMHMGYEDLRQPGEFDTFCASEGLLQHLPDGSLRAIHH